MQLNLRQDIYIMAEEKVKRFTRKGLMIVLLGNSPSILPYTRVAYHLCTGQYTLDSWIYMLNTKYLMFKPDNRMVSKYSYMKPKVLFTTWHHSKQIYSLRIIKVNIFTKNVLFRLIRMYSFVLPAMLRMINVDQKVLVGQHGHFIAVHALLLL